MPVSPVALPRKTMESFCARNRIRKLSLFGSPLTERFRPESDLDLLVEFDPGARITYLDMARMEAELGKLLGHKVDLRTPQELSRYFRDEVLAAAVVQYERR